MIVVGERTAQCPPCRGTGWIAGTVPARSNFLPLGHTCTACGGTGTIRQAEQSGQEPSA